MGRYIVPIVALLLSCGSAQFRSHQDGETEEADAFAENSTDTEIMAEGLEGSGADNLAAGTMTKDASGGEIFPVGIVGRKLDILLVIDNSTTMNRVNMRLSEKIAPLLSEISTSDWQIAVTTSTKTDCLRGILTNGKHGDEEFKEIVSKVHSKYLSRRDLISSNSEQVVRMATRALQGMPLAKNAGQGIDIDCRGAKQHWVREGSMLVVLLISDEDADDPHHEIENRCENLSCIDAFYEQLSRLREPHVSAKVYGIVDKRANHTQREASHPSFNRSDLYLQWRDAVEGKPLFDYHHALYNGTNINDLGIILGKVSAHMSSALQNVFVLSNTYDDRAMVTLIKSEGNSVMLSHDTYMLTRKTLVIDPDQLVGAVSVRIERH